ncbi:RNA polymerase sigma factor [Methylomonas methanica]|uniref:RNA polymerase subunit sigma-24 n=1 Tax=Methylomonas methanica TaxID=421 RepID=A0A177M780_METMH|nr:sigma-70 family RNA polymerase sigma factor [Methylomonas methanica]OAI01588.1 RNA polymerase subunit sigma-24 [Methylomonas methanica]
MLELTATDIADLMHKHRRELLGFLSQRISCAETAQDIFQETFIRYAGYGSKDQIENPRAFIFRIASNLATDYLRSHSRHSGKDIETSADDEAEGGEQSALSVERTVMSQQQLEQLIAALDELSPKCREVFVLLKLKHCSYAEVEQRLSISQTMIFKYLTQALRHCRQRIGDLD